MLDKEDPEPIDAGGCGLSSSGVASPSLIVTVTLVGSVVFSSTSSEVGISSSSSASTVNPNSFLSRSVRSSRLGSGGGEAFPSAANIKY